jgi:hypothetical protein
LVQLAERPIFPVSADESVPEIEQESRQIGGLLKVAPVARDDIHVMEHDLVEIFETETPRALKDFLA